MKATEAAPRDGGAADPPCRPALPPASPRRAPGDFEAPPVAMGRSMTFAYASAITGARMRFRGVLIAIAHARDEAGTVVRE